MTSNVKTLYKKYIMSPPLCHNVIFVKQVVVGYIITFFEQRITWESDCAWVITFDEVNACGMYRLVHQMMKFPTPCDMA
jgi:hypothetical protein